MATPKPWPEGTIPTSVQLTDWFLEQPHDEQVALMSMMLNDARVAAACWQQDHGGILVTLDQLEAKVADLQNRDLVVEWRGRANRYRTAWLSARRFRRSFRAMVAELDREAERRRGLQTIDLAPADAGEVALFAVDVDTEVQLATTYADYLPEPEGSPKPSGYCVSDASFADHAKCEGRGHLGQPCDCTCHEATP